MENKKTKKSRLKTVTKAVAILSAVCLAAVMSSVGIWLYGKRDLDHTRYTYPDFGDGTWQSTMNVDFSAVKSMEELNAANWFASPHGLRNYEYWCPDMIEFRTGEALVINSRQEQNHVCSYGDKCPDSGVFTGGIETRDFESGTVPFSQAFGFFEAEVQVPKGSGMWSAFWLQCAGTNKIGKGGTDGSEIDIYESSFIKNPQHTGHAIHFDAYEWPFYQSYGKVVAPGNKVNLYEGYHRYGLLWTKKAYVFFIDGEPTWATDFGGVSRVPEFLRLTVEIRTGGMGPYGQDIGEFSNSYGADNEFKIKRVTVYEALHR